MAQPTITREENLTLKRIIEDTLDAIRAARLRGEIDLYLYTSVYFRAINLAKYFLPEDLVEKYQIEYKTIINQEEPESCLVCS